MNPDALQVALHLYDNLGSWPASVEVRCEKGCTLALAWLMPNDQVVVLVNPRRYRVSPQWRDGRIEREADLPAGVSAETVWEPNAYIMQAAPNPAKPGVVGLCRHAQKYPLTVLALDMWEAAHDPQRPVLSAPIPNVAESRANDKARHTLAPLVGESRRRLADTP